MVSHIALKSYISFGQTLTNTTRISGYNNPVHITHKGLRFWKQKTNDNNDWVAQKLNSYSSKLRQQLAVGAMA